MPKGKTTLIQHRNISTLRFPCQICGFFTRSETAMRLHRKSRHGLTTKYEHPSLLIICYGCSKEKSNCKCSSH